MNMKKKSGIYMWTSPSGKSYIGQAVNLKKRYNSFLRFNKNYSGDKVNNARKKYNNKSDWKYEVLEYCDINELDEREKYYIALYDTMNNGYNSNAGGDGNRGFTPNELTRDKLRQAQIKYHLENPQISYAVSEMLTKRWKDENYRNNFSKKMKGENNPFYGKKHSKESLKANSEWHKKYGSGVNHPMYGRTGRDNPLSMPIIQLSIEGAFIREWSCAKEAADNLGANRKTINECCNGRIQTSHGFKWMKATDYYATHTYKNPPLLNKNEGLNKN